MSASTPLCDRCAYELRGIECRDGWYTCPECGKAHLALGPLVCPPWPGWRRVLARAAWPLGAVLAAYAVWLLLTPMVAQRDLRTGGFIMVFAAFLVFPVLVLAGVAWGPSYQSRRYGPGPGGLAPSRARIFWLAIALNAAIVVATWFIAEQWIAMQLVRSMPD